MSCVEVIKPYWTNRSLVTCQNTGTQSSYTGNTRKSLKHSNRKYHKILSFSERRRVSRCDPGAGGPWWYRTSARKPDTLPHYTTPLCCPWTLDLILVLKHFKKSFTAFKLGLRTSLVHV